jgi:cell division protein FtsQ
MMATDMLDYDPRYLPAPYRRFRHSVTWVCGGLIAVAILVWGWALDVPGKIWFGLAQGVAGLGLQVDNIEIQGVRNTPKLAIYASVLAQNSNSMLLVDIDDIRSRVEAIAWVDEASVARRLPNTLEIRVVERQPAAVWQYRGHLALMDADGHIIDRVSRKRYSQHYSSLPLIVGQNADKEAPKLWSLLKSEPDLRAKLRAASFVSGRRWDIVFDSGETLSLPEGHTGALAAYAKFADFQSKIGLLGRGFARFDMRLNDRLVVRKGLVLTTAETNI